MSLERETGKNGAVRQRHSHREEPRAALAPKETSAVLTRCPDFALEDDPHTSLLFPSAEGLCYRALPPATPKLAHQRAYCLKSQHATCPVFRLAKRGPMPVDLVEPRIRYPTFSLKLSPPISTLALIAVIILLLAAGGGQVMKYLSSAPTQEALTSTPVPSPSPVAGLTTQSAESIARNRVSVATPTSPPQPTMPNTASPPATVTPLSQPTETVEPTPTPSSTPSPLPTEEPTATPTQVPRVVVLVDFLNIRTGPGLNYPILALASLDSQYEVVGRLSDNSWWQVCCVNENVGWMFGEAVALDGSIESLPIITDIPAPPASQP